MLQDAQRISAPRAIKVSISTAVWIVMCREPAILAPLRGFWLPYSSRVAIKPGISTSAMAISLRPQSAKLMSLMAQSLVGVMAILLGFQMRLAPAFRRRAYTKASGTRQAKYKEFFMSLIRW